MKSIRFNHKSSSALLILFEDGRVTLSNIYSTDRRKGHATALLGMITDYADENGMNLALAAMAYDGEAGPNSLQLKAFYEKFGFVAHNPDAIEYITMERKVSKS